VSRWSHPDGIEFPELKNQNVTLIIGSDVPEAHWALDQRRGRRKEAYAVRTLERSLMQLELILRNLQKNIKFKYIYLEPHLPQAVRVTL
jgi:hypothetical protein